MSANPYETRRYLHEYLLLHYGRPRDLCPFSFVPRQLLRFHARLCEEYLLPLSPCNGSRALDLGCAVGRFAFELGRVARNVLGIDNSKSFILAARRMAKRHILTVPVKESGTRFTPCKLVLPKYLQGSRVEFRVGDASNLAAMPDQSFEVISAMNLIDRLASPRRFLRQMSRLITPGGQLLIASPFTWLEEFTPRKEWLSPQQVQSLLRPDFRLARHGDLPFLIREHRRKSQLVVAEVFGFIRRGR